MVWREGVTVSYNYHPIRKAKCGVLILVPSSARLHCVLRLKPVVQSSASSSGSLPSSTPGLVAMDTFCVLAVSQKKVPNVLSRCHTKIRMDPSFFSYDTDFSDFLINFLPELDYIFFKKIKSMSYQKKDGQVYQCMVWQRFKTLD